MKYYIVVQVFTAEGELGIVKVYKNYNKALSYCNSVSNQYGYIKSSHIPNLWNAPGGRLWITEGELCD